MRKIGIMIGSDSDLPQCLLGFKYLKRAEEAELCQVEKVITSSIHRNTDETLENLRIYTKHRNIDIWIIGAGWANHLTGIADSYLRYHLKNNSVPVIGVAFDAGDEEKNLAAFLSIEHVPGHQVIFDRQKHFGEDGFLFACKLAIKDDFTKSIVLKESKSVEFRTLDQAITEARKRRWKKQ